MLETMDNEILSKMPISLLGYKARVSENPGRNNSRKKPISMFNISKYIFNILLR